jgi:hypothetical protein
MVQSSDRAPRARSRWTPSPFATNVAGVAQVGRGECIRPVKGSNHTIRMAQVGPLREAEVSLADLTVLVGPQASGKSIFLQVFKLLLDLEHAAAALGRHGYVWTPSVPSFLEVFMGEGMGGVWGEDSRVWLDGAADRLEERLARARRSSREASAFYIPAQRVLGFEGGLAAALPGLRAA